MGVKRASPGCLLPGIHCRVDGSPAALVGEKDRRALSQQHGGKRELPLPGGRQGRTITGGASEASEAWWEWSEGVMRAGSDGPG